ncbi:platelet-activating factor receptor [Desmodus rotundus]|uniref:platelet-activating factor receptor n=1 Tax=Desmodus rotundus TaxID=9430 RepID=UPI00238154A3|nr:lysophosphatidic acid receptor 6-like [Desmodus rotundus]
MATEMMSIMPSEKVEWELIKAYRLKEWNGMPDKGKNRNPAQVSAFTNRDHMKDFRRYLAFKYIQYLVLPSTNIIVTLLGLSASLYVTLVLLSPSVSRKSTAVFICNIAQADMLVVGSIFSAVIQHVIKSNILLSSFQATLRQNFQIANTHISSLLLSCVSLEAFLITFLPAETRHIRTVRSARVVSKIIWVTVITECFFYQMECVKEIGISSLGIPKQIVLLLNFCFGATKLLKSFVYPIGLFLRIFNVYLFYKIYFRALP